MIRLCISSQTPPLRPIGDRPKGALGTWKLGADYVPQLGGVVPMMRALIREGRRSWLAPRPLWVAMGGAGIPERALTSEGYLVETVDVSRTERELYGRFKERVWRSFHGPGFPEFVPEEYRAFVAYSHATANHLLQHLGEYDLFYINDFQQILCGAMIGAAAPSVLRWHIPLEFRGYPEPVRRFFLRLMEDYDAIVVSTKAALVELIRAGFHGRAYQVYPYVDPREQKVSTTSETRRFRGRFGLGEGPLVLSVGRMDPVKRQDLLIEAFARVHARFPSSRLVLVGGGSFTTRQLSSSGLPSKAIWWESRIRALARRLHLQQAVALTGALSVEELRAAYASASVFVHPAPWEGFGLVVIEAWLRGLPVIVSRGAGVAELVNDGVNGYIVRSGSVPEMASRLGALLAHPSQAERMGENGRLTARGCTVQRAAPQLKEIFDLTIRHYERSGLLLDHRARNGRP
ncbi:MAG: glycosyltransferase family 4 protein [Euryarchaeota archaeon]|nr:glycosyltransferase family 4 protein [Euryarchaeota archaeon]MDE1835249.1 glycosyltransferase family 4 protein [Euryarchaeota archaeon]MDE1881089.1 glycosyltransferase family 4 protein [Euryarchaeota archaeon]MDE2043545.1 glycosyltransferase family 4 protein [Thermoplasmata archaeon]